MSEGEGIRVNGAWQPYVGETIREMLERLGWTPTAPGIAVAVNRRVVPRSTWEGIRLAAGDEVEIVGAVQGG